MKIDNVLIGAKIRHYREIKGYSQDKLAIMVDVSERHIRYIESGHKGLSVALLISLANALDIRADDLLEDYLKRSTEPQATELITIINNSSSKQKAILADMLKHMHTLLSEYEI